MFNCVLNRANLANDVTQADFDEWVKGSSISEAIARLNLKSIDAPVEIAKLLNWQKYLGTGGWYVLSCDPITGKRGQYGQFKPTSPIQFPDKDKPQKYFTFPKDGESEAIYLVLALSDWVKISERVAVPIDNEDIDESRDDLGFWRWVLNHPEIPILITEGAKKAACLLSHGWVAIALTGVWNGQKNKRLHPTLKPFVVPGRPIDLVFDADIVVKESVADALRFLGNLLHRAKAIVRIVIWDLELGKGCDDFIVAHGPEEFLDVMDNALPYSEWLKGLEQQFKHDHTGRQKPGGAKDQPPSAQRMALEIAEQYQPHWAFHNEQKTWRVFNSKSWDAVEDDAFGRMVYNVVKSKGGEWKVPAYVDNVIRILRWELMVEKWITFDRMRYIAFNNCVLDTETNSLLAHSPGFRFTSYLPFDYHPPALDHKLDPIGALAQQCPRIYEYMLRAMDGDSQRMMKLLAVINAALKFRFHDLQMFVHLVGKPGTGKGTFSRILEKIVGDANCTASSLTALDEGTEIAALIGSQLVVFPDERRQVGIEILLKLTGGDRVRYREIYKKPGNSPFYGLLLVLSNNPIFAGDTTGLERRLCLIQFLNPIPRHLRDSKAEKLMDAELPNLIPIALSLSDSQVTSRIKGLGDDEIPAFKQQEWLMKCQTSSIAFHANEWLLHDPDAEIAIGDGRRSDNGSEKETVYGHYRDCCEISGLKPFSLVGYSNNLIDLLTDALGWEVSKVRTRTGMKIKGLRLRQPGIDDQLPRIDESFTIDPPNPPDDTPPSDQPPSERPPSTPNPSGEGLVKGCEGWCEGLKPALDKVGVGFEGLNASIDLNEQHTAVAQLAEVSQHQNREEPPCTPTQPIPGKGFTPTQPPLREQFNPSQKLPCESGADGAKATLSSPQMLAVQILQCQSWVEAVSVIDAVAKAVSKPRADVFARALRHLTIDERQHLVRLLAAHIQQFPRDQWAYSWLPKSSRKLKHKALAQALGIKASSESAGE